MMKDYQEESKEEQPKKALTWDQIPKASINNIVATVQLNTGRIDLKLIAEKCRNCDYNPTKFNAAIIKIREPSATSLVFATGKMVVNGTKTIEQSQEAARTISKQIKKCYSNAHISDWSIQNIVASIDFTCGINLNALADYCKKLGMPKGKDGYQYQPGNTDGNFPGFFFKMKKPGSKETDPKVKLIVF